MLVTSGGTASNGSSASARLGKVVSGAFQHVLRCERWIRRETAQQGRSKLYIKRRLVSSTPCCHSACANTLMLNGVPATLSFLWRCPECSPAGMQQKCSRWHVTSSNVCGQHQQQPCLGQLSSGNPYSATPWGMSCPSDPLTGTLGLLGSYSNSSDPDHRYSEVKSLLQSPSLKNYCCFCTY